MGRVVVPSRTEVHPPQETRRLGRWSQRFEALWRAPKNPRKAFRSFLVGCAVYAGMTVVVLLTPVPEFAVITGASTGVTGFHALRLWRQAQREPIDVGDVFE